MNNDSNTRVISANGYEYEIILVNFKAPLIERIGAFVALMACAVASLITTFSIAETWPRFACGMLCFVTATYLSDRCTQLASGWFAIAVVNVVDIVLVGQAIWLIIQLVVSIFSRGNTPVPETCDYPCV